MNKILLIISLIAIVTSTLYMLYSTFRYYIDKMSGEKSILNKQQYPDV